MTLMLNMVKEIQNVLLNRNVIQQIENAANTYAAYGIYHNKFIPV